MKPETVNAVGVVFEETLVALTTLFIVRLQSRVASRSVTDQLKMNEVAFFFVLSEGESELIVITGDCTS